MVRYFDETIKFIINPYDEHALEQALRIREEKGGSEVIAVTAGKEAAAGTLRSALAMGADRGILIKTDTYFTDSLETSRLLKRRSRKVKRVRLTEAVVMRRVVIVARVTRVSINMSRVRSIFTRVFKWISVGVLYVIAIPAVRKWLLDKLTGRKMSSSKVIDVEVKK